MKKVFEWFEKHRTLVSLIVAVMFVVIQIPAVLAHEPGLDESATWLAAGGKAESFSYTYGHSEPKTMLWQWILTPFARMGLPIVTMSFISLALTGIAVFVILRFIKTNWFVKLCLLFSAVLFYYNPVIARCYSLIPLAIALVAALYENRLKHPLLYGLSIALLLQTHFMMAGLALCLVVWFVIDLIKARKNKDRSKKYAFLPNFIKFVLPVLVAIGIGIWQVVESANLYVVSEVLSTEYVVETLFIEINLALFGVNFPLIVFTLIPAIAYLLIYHTKKALMLAVGLMAAVFSMLFVYNGPHYAGQKGAVLLAIVALVIFLAGTEKTRIKKTWEKVVASIALALPFAATIPQTVAAMSADLAGDFGYTAHLARFLNEFEEDAIFVVAEQTAETMFVPIKATTDINIYNGMIPEDPEKMGVTESYERQYEHLIFAIAPEERIENALVTLTSLNDNVYLVVEGNICPSSDASFPDITYDLEPVAGYDLPEGLADYPDATEDGTTTLLFYKF